MEEFRVLKNVLLFPPRFELFPLKVFLIFHNPNPSHALVRQHHHRRRRFSSLFAPPRRRLQTRGVAVALEEENAGARKTGEERTRKFFAFCER